MRFNWHPPKAARVLRLRRISQADVERAFADPGRYEIWDDREDYGEDRYIVTGDCGGRLITFVYTQRGDTLHIITAWPATRSEAEDYESSF